MIAPRASSDATGGGLQFQAMEDLQLLWIPAGLVFIIGFLIACFLIF